ncbi:MAG TPA: Rdx family protein [Thermomicrobiales bacterium]|nr:Rdx family protein [Thermomicrobiales bacterium]
MPRAASLAEHLLHDYTDELTKGVTLIPGKTGSFEVFLNDQRLFSKLERERFPEENEVETKVGEALAG